MTALRTLLAVTAMATASIVGAGPSAGATELELGVITIGLDGPPSVETVVDVRLFVDGEDVTDAYCGPLEVAAGSIDPFRICDGLPDGTYSAAVVGAPAGTIQDWGCTDSVATPTEPDSIRVDAAFDTWGCYVVVTPPGVLLDADNSTDENGDPVPTLDIDIRNELGELVSVDCEDDIAVPEKRWCVPLPVGVYTPTVADIPEGERGSASCSLPNLATETLIEISDATPFWRCAGGFTFPPLIVVLGAAAFPDGDLSWLELVELTLTGEPGDLSSSCIRRVIEEAVEFAEWECFGLDAGEYFVNIGGIPDELDVLNECDPVVVEPEPVLDAAICGISASLLEDPVTTTPPTETTAPPSTIAPSPTGDLPATGSSSGVLTLLALASILVGLFALGTARSGRPLNP